MTTYQKSIIILLSIATIIGVFNIVWVTSYIGIKLDKDKVSMFIDIVIAVGAIIAAIIYYRTLLQIKDQSKNLNKQTKLLRKTTKAQIAQLEFNDYNKSIDEFIKIEKARDNTKRFKKHNKNKEPFNLLEFSNVIPDLVDELKRDKDYQIDTQNPRIPGPELEKKSYYGNYMILQYLINDLFVLSYRVHDLFISRINTNDILAKSQKDYLVKKLCKEVLFYYFYVVTTEQLNITLIEANGKKDVNLFNLLQLNKYLKIIETEYPHIVKEILDYKISDIFYYISNPEVNESHILI